jgi:acyl carrier protein
VIPLRTAEQADRVLAPKVAGTLALMRALEGETLDFVALCSSLTAITGGFGQADYCAANAFLDTVAWSRANEADGKRPRVVSINWDGWREVGMAVETELPKALQAARRESLRFGLSTEEGVEAFRRAMELGSPQVAISTIDLGARLATFRGAAAGAGGGAEGENKKATAARHARPALATEFVEPRGEVETQLAEIWAAALGVEKIGALDNFFDLGGDSLSALSVAAAVKKALRCSVAVTQFYEAPTVRLLAAELALETRAGK